MAATFYYSFLFINIFIFWLVKFFQQTRLCFAYISAAVLLLLLLRYYARLFDIISFYMPLFQSMCVYISQAHVEPYALFKNTGLNLMRNNKSNKERINNKKLIRDSRINKQGKSEFIN